MTVVNKSLTDSPDDDVDDVITTDPFRLNIISAAGLLSGRWQGISAVFPATTTSASVMTSSWSSMTSSPSAMTRRDATKWLTSEQVQSVANSVVQCAVAVSCIRQVTCSDRTVSCDV